MLSYPIEFMARITYIATNWNYPLILYNSYAIVPRNAAYTMLHANSSLIHYYHKLYK